MVLSPRKVRGKKMTKYKIADIVFEAETKYAYTGKLCEKYVYTGEENPVFSAVITDSDVERERKGLNAPEPLLESIALQRKFCEYVLKNGNGTIFHSSAVAYKGEAYLFTAPSGTGKSTHTRLWKEMLGDKLAYIDDDKPIIRYIDGEFYVYGTPWNGKHHLGENVKARLKCVCKIYQAKENTIRKAEIPEMIGVVFNQTLRPEQAEDMEKLLSLTDKLLTKSNLYALGCNISREAAELSFTTMTGEKIC